MQIGMRQISVEWFGPACKGGGLTRTALARALCERENWFGGVGRPCLASARKLLARLGGASSGGGSDFPDRFVSCPLRELGALSLDPVTEAEERRRWEA